MSDMELEPMEADMRSLLRGASDAYAPPAGADARVLERLALTIPALIGPGPGGGPAGGSSGGSPGSNGAPPTHPGGGSAASAAGTSAAHASLLGKMIAPLAIALVVGGAGGYAVSRATAPETVRYVYVDRVAEPVAAPVAPSGTTAVLRADQLPLVPTAPRALPAVVVTAPVSSASSATIAESRTASERGVLDEARAELSQGHPAQALALLREHATKYPNGLLREERDAMMVRALAQSGSIDEARMRAVDFKSRYPNSILAPAVDSAVKPRP